MSLLQPGQTVKMANALWRVDYVNDCRARLIPLGKRHVLLEDGTEFDTEGRAVNVSPNSLLEVVDDLQRARDELELREAERELARLRAEEARGTSEVAALERELLELRRQAGASGEPATVATPGTKAPGNERDGARWRMAQAAPWAAEGTLKACLLKLVAGEAGRTTRQLHALVKVTKGLEKTSAGAVAACLDRLWDAGVLTKE